MSKRNLKTCQKSPIIRVSKETYIHVERDQFKKRLLINDKCQKKPMYMSWERRIMNVSKETFLHFERDQ